MGFTAFVDVAIGLALVYVGASLFVTVANEYIAQMLALRSKELLRSLQELLDTRKLKELAGKEPALRGVLDVVEAVEKRGSYVDPKVLAQSLVGALRIDKAGMAGVAEAIGKLPDSQLKSVLLMLSQSSERVEKFADDVEQWADRSLKVLGEGYKKNVQWISLVLGFVIAIGLNIDTLELSGRLYRDKELRERTAAAAELLTSSVSQDLLRKCQAMKPDALKASEECKKILEVMQNVAKRGAAPLDLPVGWENRQQFFDRAWSLKPDTVQHWIGWLLTALAISIGAPFWFDLLNRLVNVRHGIRRPEPEKT